MTAAELLTIFERCYLEPAGAMAIIALGSTQLDGVARTDLRIRIDGVEHSAEHHGIGPVEALTRLLGEHGRPVDIISLHQTSLRAGNDSEALTLVEHRDRAGRIRWAAGRDRSVLTATVHAVARCAAT
ncbi:alpha-isopropylmalate synthase regulatory domain-containing protein [Nocardioides alcanivorans]|uniref:alpha-isopropylmalate synthase regulatory domain-containing protein n=1 Tax=Nocardioides alcanivorans TaxID=2897352 RepID=UPI001F2C7744|nr:alpha-isopropylmalate synthase regulatory domain-containing protein [Nocardioides alcanivorans]